MISRRQQLSLDGFTTKKNHGGSLVLGRRKIPIMEITYACWFKGKQGQGSIPFTRIVEWGRDLWNAKRYLVLNYVESVGLAPYEPRRRGRARLSQRP